MRLKPILQRVRDLWSLAKGLGITGNTLVARTATVHYPAGGAEPGRDSGDPSSWCPGPMILKRPNVSHADVMNICPSGCITVAKMKPPKPDPARMQIRAAVADGKAGKPTAPKEPETYLYDYSLCSLCGMCAEVCPVVPSSSPQRHIWSPGTGAA